MVEIKTTCCGAVIFSGETVRLAVESAVTDGVSLRYADLSHLWLPDVNLYGADLEYANLSYSVFRDSNLRGASIMYANVEDADFRGADFRDVCHTGVVFRGTQLRGARTLGMWSREIMGTLSVGNPGAVFMLE